MLADGLSVCLDTTRWNMVKKQLISPHPHSLLPHYSSLQALYVYYNISTNYSY